MAQAVAEAIAWLARNWSLIARLIGLGVVATVGYEVGKAVVGSSEAFESAISISAYAIPIAVYTMVFNMVINTIRAINAMTESITKRATS